jgi:hypothetical protein
MCNDDDSAENHSKCLPSLLAFHNAILNSERERVIKEQSGSVETDLVLREISSVLFVTPFEAHGQPRRL